MLHLGRKWRSFSFTVHERESTLAFASTPEGVMCFFSPLEFRELCCGYFSVCLFLLLGSKNKNCVLLLGIIPGRGLEYKELRNGIIQGRGNCKFTVVSTFESSN